MTPLIHQLAVSTTAFVQCSTGESCDTGLPLVQASGSSVALIFQLLFGVIGALAVLIIVISGLRFILANGDPQTISQARNTIIYAVVGLAVAVSAEIIVTFVLGHV
jgi:hypothetical protein